ncbi:type I secretion membrane fusion protein, HlyD family [compost metagenome]
MIIFLGLVALPFIYIDISIKSNGFIESASPRAILFTPISGRVLEVNMQNNQKVKPGVPLLLVDQTLPEQQQQLIDKKIKQTSLELTDVERIILGTQSSILPQLSLQTDLYNAILNQYLEQMESAIHRHTQAKSDYQRHLNLYNKGVVSRATYETYYFNLQQAESEQLALYHKQRSQWQAASNQYHKELIELRYNKAELIEQRKGYALKAGIQGSLQNIVGLKVGDHVFANQKIGEISPDGDLFAYCAISPSQIAYIKVGQKVSFNINSYPHYQWGRLSGVVCEIADEVIFESQHAYFRVKCKLEQKYLQLKNGYRAEIKKGMSFSASFIVAKRSLYQLLYDKVDNWFNPIENVYQTT